MASMKGVDMEVVVPPGGRPTGAVPSRFAHFVGGVDGGLQATAPGRRTHSSSCCCPVTGPVTSLPLPSTTSADFCLCNIDTCLGSNGYYQCNAPAAPGTPPPQQPPGTRVVVQAGLVLQRLNGSTFPYNSTIDASVSTQYSDTWNHQQGVTGYWPENPTLDLGDNLGSDHTSFRVLIKFERLPEMVPPGATFNRANVNLTFINWGGTVTLQARPRARGAWPRASGWQGVAGPPGNTKGPWCPPMG
jgi:hypothetical protein